MFFVISGNRNMDSTRSHKLLSGELMPPKRSAEKLTVLDTVLCSCLQNEVSVYCKEHCSLVCVDCEALHHKRCHTSDIGDISKDFDVDSTEETIDNWNKLNETIASLADSREKDLNNLTLEAKDCRDRAKQFREELSIKLESMEAKTLLEIDILETQETKTITQQLDTCKADRNSLDTDRRNLILAKERNDKQSIFVYNIQLSQTMKSLTTITEEITKEVYQPHISFKCNPTITIAGDQDLGTVKCHTTRTPQQMGRRELVTWLSLSAWCFGIVVWLILAVPWVCLEFLIGVFTDHMVKCHTTRTLQQKGFDEMSVTARNQVNIKVQSDSNNAWITGSAFLPSGQLILCDGYNKRLILLDENLQMKESIDVPGTPGDVAPINQH